MPGQISLISFADGPFKERIPWFIKSASHFAEFDDVAVFNLADLDSGFREMHLQFMRNNPKGLGYYIWKPQVILQALETASRDDVVVYVDAGCEFNLHARDRFREYIELTRDSEYKMLSFSQIFVEAHYTKMDLAYRLGLTERDSHLKTSQLLGGIVFLQRSASNLNLVRECIQICSEDRYRFLDDSPSSRPNHSRFKGHRHDQSVFSLLRKMRGTETSFAESTLRFHSDFSTLKGQIPIYALRLRGRAESEPTSPIAYVGRLVTLAANRLRRSLRK
jgi:hypothetical protein